ncbi:hypothetical protein Cgig2_003396 [Carnegiea gigantea]|uniref:26S proteasome regulatory subunit RPN11 C-terminal domain-containing protein n=1 Tax=Carnegiea gigantea TaxID=171969 RepID=A0A9Q1Q4E3_9CARY|nr:hypothetical protein Cgig2_003396 [Carnegiea gigantea]
MICFGFFPYGLPCDFAGNAEPCQQLQQSRVQEEDKSRPRNAFNCKCGKQDTEKYLDEHVSHLMSTNMVQTLGVDINICQSFEALNQQTVSVVVDPIQSIEGTLVIGVFCLMNPQTMVLGQEPHQTTSNCGRLNTPSIQSFEALNQQTVSVVVDPIQSIEGTLVIGIFCLMNPQTMVLGQEPHQTTSNCGHLNTPSIQAWMPDKPHLSRHTMFLQGYNLSPPNVTSVMDHGAVGTDIF